MHISRDDAHIIYFTSLKRVCVWWGGGGVESCQEEPGQVKSLSQGTYTYCFDLIKNYDNVFVNKLY